jgi:HEAT repeat protein
MLNWLKKIRQTWHPEIPEQKAAPVDQGKAAGAPAPPPQPVHPAPNPDPILVRGRLWKNTGETRWELARDQASPPGADTRDLIRRLGRGERVETRRSAARSLGEMGPCAAPAIPALLGSCVDMDASVRETALEALEKIDPDWPAREETRMTIPKLVQALRSWSPEVGRAALDVLECIGPPAIPELVAVLASEEDRIDKVYAIRLLAGLGLQAESAVPGLTRALGSSLLQVRIAAAQALEEMGPAACRAIPTLAVCLADPYADGREAMASCLAQMGPAAEPAIPALLLLLADRDSKVRKAAVRALQQIGPAAEPALIELVQARDARRINAWLDSMRRTSQWYSVPSPESMVVDDRDAWNNISWNTYTILEQEACLESAQEAALRVLGELDISTGAAVPAIMQALSDRNPNIQLTAVQALGRIGPPAIRSLPGLLFLLLHHDSEVIRKAAAGSLKSIDPAWMSNPALAVDLADLTRKLGRPGPDGQKAVLAFAALGPDAIPLLDEARLSGDTLTRENAAQVLAILRQAADKRKTEEDRAGVAHSLS